MGQVYTILSATEGRTYNGKYGEMVVWNVQLENATPENGAGSFELHKKPGNTPQAGDTVDVKRFAPGDFDGTPHVRIFAEAPQGGASSSTGGGGGSYQKSPDQQRSIVRQHSQEMALRLIEATGDARELNLSDGKLAGAYLNGTVKRLTDWFARDAGAEAPAPPVQSNGAPQEVPVDTTDLQPAAAAPGDSEIPF